MLRALLLDSVAFCSLYGFFSFHVDLFCDVLSAIFVTLCAGLFSMLTPTVAKRSHVDAQQVVCVDLLLLDCAPTAFDVLCFEFYMLVAAVVDSQW